MGPKCPRTEHHQSLGQALHVHTVQRHGRRFETVWTEFYLVGIDRRVWLYHMISDSSSNSKNPLLSIIQRSSTGLLAWGFPNTFTYTNSQNKYLYVQNIFLIFEYVWAKRLYHSSKSFKHLERDSTQCNINMLTYFPLWCMPWLRNWKININIPFHQLTIVKLESDQSNMRPSSIASSSPTSDFEAAH